jgi:CHAT domain-containing protein/tetratricopeptide (TPR) repeat protein
MCESVICGVESERLDAYLGVRRMMGKEMYSVAVAECKRLIEKYPDYKYLYETLPEACLYAGDVGEAERFFTRRIVDGYGVPYCYFGLGNACYRRKDFGSSLRAYQRARDLGLDIAEIHRGLVYSRENIYGVAKTIEYYTGLCHRLPNRAEYWYALALSHWGRTDYDNAYSTIEEALRRSPSELRFLQLRSAIILMKKPTRKNLEAGCEILFASFNVGDLDGLEFLRWTLVNTYRSLGMDSLYTQSLGASLQSVASYGQLRWLGHAKLHISNSALAAGKYDESLAAGEEAILAFKRCNDIRGSISGGTARLHALSELGRQADALKQALELLVSLEGPGSETEHAAMLIDVAFAFNEIGASDVALEYAIQALNENERIPFLFPNRIRLHSVLGHIHQSLENPALALKHHRIALQLCGRVRTDDRVLAICEGNVGIALLSSQRPNEARFHIMNQLRLAEKIACDREKASAFENQARLEVAGKNLSLAHILFERALEIAQRTKQMVTSLRCLRGLGDVAGRSEKWQEAAEYYRMLLSERRIVASPRLMRVLSRRSEASYVNDYRNYIGMLCKSNCVAEAFAAAEQVRSELSGDPFLISNGSQAADIADSLSIVVHRYKRLVSKSYAIAKDRNASFRPAELAKIDLRLMNCLSDLELQYGKLLLRIGRNVLSYAPRLASDTPLHRDLQLHALGSEESLVEYVVGDCETEVFLCTRDTLLHFTIQLTRGNLDSLIDTISLVLKDNQETGFVSLGGFIPFNFQRAWYMYSVLVRPIVKHIEKRSRLFIVRDGPLNRLPFELLVMEEEKTESTKTNRKPYMLRKFEISYISSGQELLLRGGRSHRGSMTLLAFGDPKSNDQIRNGTESNVLGDEYVDRRAALPWARREVRSLGEMFGEKSKVLVGESATEDAFRRYASAYRIVHFAAHAIHDSIEPMFSSIRLAGSNDTLDDGFLMAYEIGDVELNADLVVLSACRTYDHSTLLGMEGLVRGFNLAGVNCVVATAWEIDDLATKNLMESFYRRILEGVSKSQALQRAKLDLIDLGFADPHKWAGFLLMGDGSSPVGEREEIEDDQGAVNRFIVFGFVLLAAIVVGKVLLSFKRKGSPNMLA